MAETDQQLLAAACQHGIERCRELLPAPDFGDHRSPCASTAKVRASALSEAGFHEQLNDQVPNTSAPTTFVRQLLGRPPERVRRSPSTKCSGLVSICFGSKNATR